MIDVHCHIDQYPNPLQIATECERLGIITIGMTNIPSHFELGYNHLLSFKKVRLALGMHPLYADQHEKEFAKFKSNLNKTSYIGEIGLDFSREGIATKEKQVVSFDRILSELKGKKKLLSIHSRKAEKEVLQSLIRFEIENAIFHWYSGPVGLIEAIAKKGYYFSINPAMIKSKNGQEIINRIPKEKVLTESDGPFIERNDQAIKPKNIREVHTYLSILWNMPEEDIEELIFKNFNILISRLK
jgi:TatD DNase family protein